MRRRCVWHSGQSEGSAGQRHGEDCPEAFSGKTLIYKVKKEQPATEKQKQGLRDLVKYHKIDILVQIDALSRNEVSRIKDKIISQYGRLS